MARVETTKTGGKTLRAKPRKECHPSIKEGGEEPIEGVAGGKGNLSHLRGGKKSHGGKGEF